MNPYEHATLSSKGNDKIKSLFYQMIHSLTGPQLDEFGDPARAWVNDEGKEQNPLVPDILVVDDEAHLITCNGEPLVYVKSSTLFDDDTDDVEYCPAVDLDLMMVDLVNIHIAERITTADWE